MQTGRARLASVERIWDRAQYNSFTDLTRFGDRFYCVFREATIHQLEPGGAVRMIVSEDAESWDSAGLFALPGWDLRDPQITVTPDDQLMVHTAIRRRLPDQASGEDESSRWPDTRNFVWFSEDGEAFGVGHEFAEPGGWAWRVTWHRGVAYTVSYGWPVDRQAVRQGESFVRLYRSDDGINYEVLVEQLFVGGSPSEATLLFLDDDTGLCLLRRDGEDRAAQLGTSQPPYVEWQWQDLGMHVGGPNLIALPDGRIIAGGRKHHGAADRCTALWEVDRTAGRLEDLLELPSGGDSSYPGFLWHDDMLYVSYYSSHEEKTCIYLARVEL